MISIQKDKDNRDNWPEWHSPGNDYSSTSNQLTANIGSGRFNHESFLGSNCYIVQCNVCNCDFYEITT